MKESKDKIKGVVKEVNGLKRENKFKTLCKDYISFYKTNIRKKQIIVFVISLVILFIGINMLTSNIDIQEQTKTILENQGEIKGISQANNIQLLYKEKIPALMLIIFAGITPFCYLPVLGLYFPYTLALDISAMFYLTAQTGNIVAMTIGAIIQLLGSSLAITTGIYYCILSTKKFRYSQRRSFGMFDVKKNIYQMTKKDEKLEILEKEQEEKLKQREELNVKVPYKMLLVSALISLVILVVGAFVSLI